MSCYKKVIIIGAPRSGTNMLRDMLNKLSGVGTWDCDEINYLWRHGNAHYPSDEFLPTMATQYVIKYMQLHFDAIAKNTHSDVVLEKTCANSLRVSYVDKVVPDARYIFIVRNGLDVVASAVKRWRGKASPRYLLKKAKYVPVSDFAYYLRKFLQNKLQQIVSRDKELDSWGPILDGMTELRKQYTLEELCALQWKRCVEKAEMDLSCIPSHRVLRVSYEQFVRDPVPEFRRIARYIGKDVSPEIDEFLRKNIVSTSVGRSKYEDNAEQISAVYTLIADTLRQYGYDE